MLSKFNLIELKKNWKLNKKISNYIINKIYSDIISNN